MKFSEHLLRNEVRITADNRDWLQGFGQKMPDMPSTLETAFGLVVSEIVFTTLTQTVPGMLSSGLDRRHAVVASAFASFVACAMASNLDDEAKKHVDVNELTFVAQIRVLELHSNKSEVSPLIIDAHRLFLSMIKASELSEGVSKWLNGGGYMVKEYVCGDSRDIRYFCDLFQRLLVAVKQESLARK